MIFLDLTYSRFDQLDLNVFKGLKQLPELNLNGYRLTDINVEDLKNTTKPGILNG